MKTYKAPQPVSDPEGMKIFLAGTIDMGNSINWQEKATKFFEGKTCTILNPRRDDWHSSWQQSAANEQFNTQVTWELEALEQADLIIMNFLEGSQSPVTMLELGLHAGSNKVRVCCPDAFWRSGNIHMVCRRYGIPLYNDLNELLNDIQL